MTDDHHHHHDHAGENDTRKIVGVEPIFIVNDAQRSKAHYERLGLATSEYDEHDAFAERWHVNIHLAEADPTATAGAGCIYIHVDDADALADEWRRAGLDVVGPDDYDSASERARTRIQMGIASGLDRRSVDARTDDGFRRRRPGVIGDTACRDCRRCLATSQKVGAEGIRTPDLCRARAALSQLSYRPETRGHAEAFRSIGRALGAPRTWACGWRRTSSPPRPAPAG